MSSLLKTIKTVMLGNSLGRYIARVAAINCTKDMRLQRIVNMHIIYAIHYCWTYLSVEATLPRSNTHQVIDAFLFVKANL